VFVSTYFELVCARIGTALIHSKPYDSPSRGKIERVIRTIRLMFLPNIVITPDYTLEMLNADLKKWITVEYHQKIHSTTGQKPIERYTNDLGNVRIKEISRHESDQFFYHTIYRKVRNDCTINFHNQSYEVPARYIGRTVEIRYPLDNVPDLRLFDDNKQVARLLPLGWSQSFGLLLAHAARINILMQRIPSPITKTKEKKQMYKIFYGFSGEPFAKDVSEQALFLHSYFKELLSRLAYIRKYRGIMLITGEPGTGKTTALRSFCASLKEQSFFPVYIPLSTVGITDFYRQLNMRLGGEPCSAKSRLFKSIQERILDLAFNQNKIPVIVIDEGHLLKTENFFELQIISNFNMDSLDPCIFILSAQTHLNDRLQRSILCSFNQPGCRGE
jgi:hypothetical protein